MKANSSSLITNKEILQKEWQESQGLAALEDNTNVKYLVLDLLS